MDPESNTELIKSETMEIVSKFGFWIITKNNLAGCAGYLHSPNRKIYLEVLFPPDYPNSPIQLNMPRDLRQHPAMFEYLPKMIELTRDPAVRAAEALEYIKAKIDSLTPKEVKESLVDELDEELNLVRSIYNIKIVDGKKYHIRIFYRLESRLNFEVEINYKDYPKKPRIIYYHGLEKIVGLPQTLEVMQRWNSNNPPHIVQIVQEIEHRFTSKQGIDDTEKLIIIRNLTLVNKQNQVLTQKISFSALRGDIIGVFCLNKEIPIALFNSFVGATTQIEGEMKIFGKAPAEKLRQSIKLINFEIPPKRAQTLEELSIEEILREYAPMISKKEIKERVNTLLSIIGLSNRRKLKFGELSEGEKRRVLIASSIMDLPSIIFLVEPEGGDLNATEKKRVWDTIVGIDDKFSSTIFVYSSSDELKRCHNILVLSREGKQLGFGTLSQLIGELPIHKEVIVIQLNAPNPEHVEIIGKIQGVSFIIEERRGEKYRIFTKYDPNSILPQIFQKIGSNIYNISKEIPSLIDYVPYKRVQS